MLASIHSSLSKKDTDFLTSFEGANPDWTIYDFKKYPVIQWKIQNLEKLKNTNPKKHLKGVCFLKEKFSELKND